MDVVKLEAHGAGEPMKSRRSKPSWLLPALILFGMIAILFFEASDHALLPIEPGIEMVTIIAGFALVALWVNVNHSALEDGEDRSRYKIILLEVDPPCKKCGAESIGQLPNSEDASPPKLIQPVSRS